MRYRQNRNLHLVLLCLVLLAMLYFGLTLSADTKGLTLHTIWSQISYFLLSAVVISFFLKTDKSLTKILYPLQVGRLSLVFLFLFFLPIIQVISYLANFLVLGIIFAFVDKQNMFWVGMFEEYPKTLGGVFILVISSIITSSLILWVYGKIKRKIKG